MIRLIQTLFAAGIVLLIAGYHFNEDTIRISGGFLVIAAIFAVLWMWSIIRSEWKRHGYHQHFNSYY